MIARRHRQSHGRCRSHGHGPLRQRARWGAACAVAAACAVLAAASAAADPPAIDVSGDWTVTTGGSFTEHYDMATDGSVTGTLVDNGASIQGQVSGYTFTWTDHYVDSSYSSTVTVTVSPDDRSFSGTFTDTNGSSGQISGVRQGNPPTSTTSTATTTTTTAATGKSAAIQVNCDRNVVIEIFTCTAQVADASGESPAQAPTGSVTWALDSGGEGVFPDGGSCTLQPSQTGGASAFCSVRYLPGIHDIPPGDQPAITATYGGDANFQPTSGAPKDEYVPPPADPLGDSDSSGCASAHRAFALRLLGPHDGATCRIPLATVQGLKGAVYKEDADGNITKLSAGSTINEGDHIITEGDGSWVDFTYTLGGTDGGRSIGANQEIVVTGDGTRDVNTPNALVKAAQETYALYKSYMRSPDIQVQYNRAGQGTRVGIKG